MNNNLLPSRVAMLFGTFICIMTIAVLSGCKIHQPVTSEYFYNYQTGHLYDVNPITSSGQTPIQTPLRYPAGHDLNITVIGFNPLNTEIEIESTSTRLFLSDTSKLAGLIILPKTVTQSPAETTSSAGTPLTAAQPSDCDKLARLKTAFKTESDKIIKDIAVFKNFVDHIDRINYCYNNLKVGDFSKERVKNQLTDNFLSPLNDLLVGLGDGISTDPNNVSQDELEKKSKDRFSVFQDSYKALRDYQAEADKLKSISTCLDSYKELTIGLTKFKADCDAFSSAYTDKYQPALRTALTTYLKLKEFLSSEPRITSDIIRIIDDEHLIKINAKNSGDTQFKTVKKILVLPSRGFKIDISAGFFVSGLADHSFSKFSKDSIYKHQYVNTVGAVRDTTTNQSFNQLSKQNQTPLSFGAALYLNAHTQRGKIVDYGGSLGFGALFNDQARLTMSIGPLMSFRMGKQRLVVTPGIAVSQVDRLSAPYKTDAWYIKTIDNIPIYRAWKASWSLGISWNL